jgi:hypothetical protein
MPQPSLQRRQVVKRTPEDRVAALDVGADAGAVFPFDEQLQVLHWYHVAAADVDASEQCDAGLMDSPVYTRPATPCPSRA